MNVDLEVAIFDQNSTTTLSLDDTVNVRELLEYIMEAFPQNFHNIDINSLQIQVSGTSQCISPSQKSLREVLNFENKAKIKIIKATPDQNSVDIFSTNNPNNSNKNIQGFQQNNQNINNQAPQFQPNNQYQFNNQQIQIPQQRSSFPQQIDVNVKFGSSQVQAQMEDNLQIHDLIEYFSDSQKVNQQIYHLYFGQLNLSLNNRKLTLREVGIQDKTILEWKMISQINQSQNQFQINSTQRAQPNQPNFQPQSNQAPIAGFGNQTNYQNQNFQPQVQQQQFQQQFQQQQFVNQPPGSQQMFMGQQAVNQGFQGRQQFNPQSQTIQNFGQQQQQRQPINPDFQPNQNQQFQQGNAGLNNNGQFQTQYGQGQGKIIVINFEIVDGNIKRQFSTQVNTQNTLQEILNAVYLYLGVSKEVASVDLLISGQQYGGEKLLKTLDMLQMTKDNQTLQVKLRWIGG